MLYIAENLKRLRKNKDMTQDDVAELLGVSPQSVSKWERGDTYPDIELLPALANLHNTSVDELIGMEKINENKGITNAFLESQKLSEAGDNHSAAKIISEALKIHPNNESLMLELALVLALDSDQGKLDEAKVLCERILTQKSTNAISNINNGNANILTTARAILCYVLLKTGEKEKAVNLAQYLPHKTICKQAVLAEMDKDHDVSDINRLIKNCNFRENPEFDVLVIDFGIDMIPIATFGNLLEEIGKLREEIGKNEFGQFIIPMVRVRDNISLAPTQVRVRYYNDFLIDKEFSSIESAASEIMEKLRVL